MVDEPTAEEVALSQQKLVKRGFPFQYNHLLYTILSPRRFWLDAKHDPTDIHICPFMKCGTTWMCQVVEQIRTNGASVEDNDNFRLFKAIPAPLPFERWDAAYLEKNRYDRQVWKSHLTYEDLAYLGEGPKYVIVLRHPHDMFKSHRRYFCPSYNVDPDHISPEWYYFNFVRIKYRTYEQHAVSWWKQRNNPNVYITSYERMKSDLPRVIASLAKHVGYELDEAALERCVQHSSVAYMTNEQNAHKFDQRDKLAFIRKKCGTPDDEPAVPMTPVVRPNTFKKSVDELPQSVVDDMERVWREEVLPVTGCANYKELSEAMCSDW